MLCALLCLSAGRVWAQEYVVAVAEENFRSRPNGSKLGTLKRGAPVDALREEGRWVKASLRGWIWKRSVRRDRAASTVSVSVERENLRASPAPSGRLLGTVLRGTALSTVGERSGWLNVAYDGWIWQPSLAADASSRGAARGGDGRDAATGNAEPLAIDRTLSVPEENLRFAPNGARLGKLHRGADLSVLGSRGGWLRVATRGYFYAASAAGSGTERRVAKPTENLRVAPGSEITGVLHGGTQLRVLGRAGSWLEVEVRGWIWEPSTIVLGAAREARSAGEPGGVSAGPSEVRSKAVRAEATEEDARVTPGQPSADRPAPLTGASASPPPRILARSVPLKDGPHGALIGQALAGSAVVPLRASGDWVKVRLEGWAPRDALAAGPSGAGVATIPMVMADPEAYRGAEATWRVELITVERANGTHGDFARGEHYLLARNATGEREYVYVAIPEGVVEKFRKIPAFTSLTVRGTVRTGRSALVGNPILEFRELVEETPRRASLR